VPARSPTSVDETNTTPATTPTDTTPTDTTPTIDPPTIDPPTIDPPNESHEDKEPPMTTPDAMLGMSMRFKLTISTYDLASWTKISGLEVSWDLVEYRAGDNDNDRWMSIGLAKYPNVKCERAANKADSENVMKWLNSNSFKAKPQTATIELQDAGLKPVMTWNLRNVMPVKWNITPFDAAGNKVAIETLELAHNGFLVEEK
jgi:phage tail-like protein